MKLFYSSLLMLSFCMVPFLLAAQDKENEPDESDIFSSLTGYYFLLGDHKGEETPGELDHPVAQFALGLGITFEYSEHINIDVELIGTSKEYETPASVYAGPFSSVDDDMTLDTTGVSVNVLARDSKGNFEVYAGAGAGLYKSSLLITGSTFGFPGSYTDRSTDVGVQIMAGIGYKITDSSWLAVEYRQLDLEGNFSSITGASSNEIGGELILLALRVDI